MGGLVPYVLFIELVAVFFYISNYYYINGKLSHYSNSVFLILSVILSLAGMTFLVGWILDNGHNKYHNALTALRNKIAKNNIVLMFFCVVMLLIAGSGVVWKKHLVTGSFALISYLTIYIVIVAMLLQILLWLIWLRFDWKKFPFDTLMRFVKNYAVFILFFLFVSIKLILLLPIVQNLALYSDALVYSQMAQQINMGRLSISDYNHYPPLYPLAISIIFSLNRLYIYHFLVVVNVLLMTSAIFPIYLISNKYFGRLLSVLIALASAVYGAQLYYPSLFMSENIAYPLFFWSLFFAVTDAPIRRLDRLWNVLLGFTIGLMWLSRYATITLLPVFLIISYFKPEPGLNGINIRLSKELIIRIFTVFTIATSLFMIWVVAGLVQGVEIRALLGLFVEGKGPKPSRSIEDILFWWGISLTYLIIMASPVFTQLIGSIKLKKPLQLWEDFQTSPYLFWHISVFLLSAVMIFVTTRHAWQASYNIDYPHNYIGRYLIYLPVLLWISGLLRLKEKPASLTITVLVMLIALLAITLSYFHLATQNWFVSEFLYSGTVDFFTYHSYSVMFIVYLCIFVLLDMAFMFLNKPNMRMISVQFFIILMFLGSWPVYLRNLGINNVLGRQFQEVIVNVLNNPQNSAMLSDKKNITIVVPFLETRDSVSLHRDELNIRGYDPSDLHLIEEKIRDVKIRGCLSVLLVKYQDIDEYLLVHGDQRCSPPQDRIVSSYTFGGTEYKLVDIKP